MSDGIGGAANQDNQNEEDLNKLQNDINSIAEELKKLFGGDSPTEIGVIYCKATRTAADRRLPSVRPAAVFVTCCMTGPMSFMLMSPPAATSVMAAWTNAVTSCRR